MLLRHPVKNAPKNSVRHFVNVMSFSNSLFYAQNDIMKHLKATALLAAKFYDVSRFDKYNEVKNLDTGYWNNSLDAVRFRQRCNESKDLNKKELYAARWVVTDSRSKRYKEQISTLFRNNF